MAHTELCTVSCHHPIMWSMRQDLLCGWWNLYSGNPGIFPWCLEGPFPSKVYSCFLLTYFIFCFFIFVLVTYCWITNCPPNLVTSNNKHYLTVALGKNLKVSSLSGSVSRPLLRLLVRRWLGLQPFEGVPGENLLLRWLSDMAVCRRPQVPTTWASPHAYSTVLMLRQHAINRDSQAEATMLYALVSEAKLYYSSSPHSRRGELNSIARKEEYKGCVDIF